MNRQLLVKSLLNPKSDRNDHFRRPIWWKPHTRFSSWLPNQQCVGKANGCFGQIITRSGLSNRFNKKISEAQVEKSKWYKDVGEEDYFSLAAQLIFLGDLVELVCSFTDLKILTKLLERMDIDLEIGLSWWDKRMLKLMQVQTGVWQTKCSLFFILGFLYWSMYSIPDTKKYSIVLLC